MQIITSIRNIKSELNISPKKEADLICRGKEKQTKIIQENMQYFQSLAKIVNISCGENIDKPSQSATSVINDVEIFLPLANLINIEIEIERLQAKINDIQARMRSVKKKLDNSNFVKNAPQNIVEHEKNKFNMYNKDYEKLKINLSNLKTE